MTFPTTHAALARALATRGYAVPTPVQLEVLNSDVSGRDLLVSAQTGSGKTVAFGLALGPTLLGGGERLDRPGKPLALIIAPTRELAMQVCRELTWLYEETGARIVTCVGGMDARAEARQLNTGAHIVVGTPGRLRDHIERGRLDLKNLKAVVLDEADEMLNLGFREDLEFILETTPVERRTLLFSATLPREIENLATRYQNDALRIQTIRRDEQHADIEYLAHRVVPQDVEHALVNVLRLHEARATLVFCSTREAVNRYHARLAERGFSTVALSGELTQNERTKALQSLRDGRSRVLVATDVAARGIDLPDLELVVHAELPHDAETLLHRSGRTGRAGRKGRCVLIVPFNRRRKAEALVAAARLKVAWTDAPSPDEIRSRDHERFLADPIFTASATDEELEKVRALQSGRTADEIALALLRLHDARLPAPEDLLPDTGPPRREHRESSKDRRPHRDPSRQYPNRDGNGDARARPVGDATFGSNERSRPRRPRPNDGRDMVWFRINIGRERNADPRWLIPLICRAGGITKAQIGTIRIDDRKTRFEIAADAAEGFEHAARTAKKKEGHIVRERPGSDASASGPESAEARDKPRPIAQSPGTTASEPPSPGKPHWRDKPKSDGWASRRRQAPQGAPASGLLPTRQGNAANKKKKNRPQT